MREQRPLSDWVAEGEKFALIGLNVHVDQGFERFSPCPGLMALGNAAFALPDYWREWLGTLRIEDIEECSLLLLASMPSAAPDIHDAESAILKDRVAHWFGGLMLCSRLHQTQHPFLVSGGCDQLKIDVRQFTTFDPPHRAVVDPLVPVSVADLKRAADIGDKLGAFKGPWQADHWRLLRCIGIYQAARCNRDLLDRVHQFTRTIEGLIDPREGDTKRQFKSRTELFIGPRHHDLMGKLYEVRSAVEHMHEYRYLEPFNREKRLCLAKLEAISEWIARDCLARILIDPDLLGHFGSVAALGEFWSLPPDQRRAIWGDPIDPLASIRGFRFDYVTDEELGARR